MAWLNKFDFGLLNAYGFKQNYAGQEVAVLMSRKGGDNDAPILEAIGTNPTGLNAHSTHTAIVNAIQSRAAVGNLGNLLVFSTYQPTDACMGIMKTHGINSVTYYQDGKQFINVRGTANVANMTPGNFPGTTRPNRIKISENLIPQPDLVANPSANPQGAQTYLNNLAQNNLEQNDLERLKVWIASWNVAHAIAGPRQIAGVQQYLNEGGGFTQDFVDTVFMLFAYTVAGRVQWPGVQAGARIAAVIANQKGQIYGWQVNHRHINTTYHAETNLVQALGPIPAGATLYTTLEPCHQCAGLFVKAGGNRCIFSQNDPNMTNNTALNNISKRLNRPTFTEDIRLDPVTVGAKLDQIRDRASVAAQAAAVAQRFNQGGTVENALQNTNYQAIQTRVLNILNTAPTLDIFHQSDGILKWLVVLIRIQHPSGDPRRTFMENIAQALNY